MNTILFVYPALATWVALAVYLWTFVVAGKSRKEHQVIAPATTGPEPFMRALRVQQNTVEQLVLFLPALWLFAIYFNPIWAGWLGLAWSAARICYALSYYKAADKRGPAFMVALLIAVILWLLSLYGIINVFWVLNEIQA